MRVQVGFCPTCAGWGFKKPRGPAPLKEKKKKRKEKKEKEKPLPRNPRHTSSFFSLLFNASHLFSSSSPKSSPTMQTQAKEDMRI